MTNFLASKISVNEFTWIETWTNLSIDSNLIIGNQSSSVQLEIKQRNRELDTVCVYNILPDDCSKCLYREFCKYKDQTKNEIECLCPLMTKGENCEIDECPCFNGGKCYLNDEHNRFECLCPYPFNGKYCESGEIE